MSVFVETEIKTTVEDLWNLTQDPAQHERWDIRFSSIEYASLPEPGQPQRFQYETRLGFGLAIRGEGETLAERSLGDGSRVSALRFWSDSPWSLIREGRGFWSYHPTTDRVRFRTVYDYNTRWGVFGRWLANDHQIFEKLWVGLHQFFFFSYCRWVQFFSMFSQDQKNVQNVRAIHVVQ